MKWTNCQSQHLLSCLPQHVSARRIRLLLAKRTSGLQSVELARSQPEGTQHTASQRPFPRRILAPNLVQIVPGSEGTQPQLHRNLVKSLARMESARARLYGAVGLWAMDPRSLASPQWGKLAGPPSRCPNASTSRSRSLSMSSCRGASSSRLGMRLNSYTKYM